MAGARPAHRAPDAVDRDARRTQPSGIGSVAGWVRQLFNSFGRTWVCGPSGLSRSVRDRLIDFDPAEPAEEDAVRIGRQDQSIAGLPGSNTARRACRRVPHVAIADADAEIRMRRAEAKIEQNRFAILRAQGVAVGASSVSAVRPPIAPSSSVRHSAMR
jgi:hypothetical protein